MDVSGTRSTMELVCEKNPKETVLKEKHQLAVMKNLPCMYTNADTLTNKMTKLKAYVQHHNPWIIAVTEIIPKNYRIPVQKAITISSLIYLNQRKRHHNPNTQRPGCSGS